MNKRLNFGRAGHYIRGAQPLTNGFGHDLSKLKFRRTSTCGSSHKVEIENLENQINNLTQQRDEVNAENTALTVEKNLLIAQINTEQQRTREINNLEWLTDNTTYTFTKQNATDDDVAFDALFQPTEGSIVSGASPDWNNGEDFRYKVDYQYRVPNSNDIWFISAPTDVQIKKIFGIKMTLDMNGTEQTATLTPVVDSARYWGADTAFTHNYLPIQLAAILENPTDSTNDTLVDNNAATVNPEANWRGSENLPANANGAAWNIIIYNYTTFKNT